MENASKALYIGSFALLFVFAITVAIFLYSSLSKFLNEETFSISISERAESATSENMTNFKRDITRGEIYVMLYNMDQMHVDKLTISGVATVTREDVEEENLNYNAIVSYLNHNPASTFEYSSSGTDVTYVKQ